MIFVKAFEGSKYKVKDCTNRPFVGINVTTDKEGNYYLDQKRAIEGVVKAARLSGAKIQSNCVIHWMVSHYPKKTLPKMIALKGVLATSKFSIIFCIAFFG